MKHYVIVFLAMLLILPVSCKKIKERGLFGKKARTLEMLLAQQDSIRVADSILRVENRLRAIEEARLDSLIRAEQEKAAYEARQKYNIVVGSFITPEYAQAWAEEYRKMGYDPQIIRMTESRFDLVVAESHEQYSRAVRRLEQFHDTVEIDAWLYVRR
ncbi:MAG: hypothetical protein JXR67_12595 [Bacteroidales bacterium]|nr:hypothetical protein [Bacteroidales bacterium]